MQVFKAKLHGSIDVAVKVTSTTSSLGELASALFRTEIDTLHQLLHPNIVQALGWYEQQVCQPGISCPYL